MGVCSYVCFIENDFGVYTVITEGKGAGRGVFVCARVYLLEVKRKATIRAQPTPKKGEEGQK